MRNWNLDRTPGLAMTCLFALSCGTPDKRSQQVVEQEVAPARAASAEKVVAATRVDTGLSDTSTSAEPSAVASPEPPLPEPVIEFDPSEREYPWLKEPPGEPLWKRFGPPLGFARIPSDKGSFANWLRHLPLKPGRPPVHLYDGELKSPQDVHVAVIDIDVGTRDLQQCADAIMRLRAEYLFGAGRKDEICFRFGRGDRASWKKWRSGLRPLPPNQKLGPWKPTGRPSSGYANFRKYMNKLFGLAGTGSLKLDMAKVAEPSRIEIGDVFIERERGMPVGHAVIVVDMAEDRSGSRAFLLAQSYMPAQEIHVLVNDQDTSMSPWFTFDPQKPFITPEWTFPVGSLMRFSKKSCS